MSDIQMTVEARPQSLTFETHEPVSLLLDDDGGISDQVRRKSIAIPSPFS